ncbi:3639_t:CDS:2, partial [Ambispora leptoticha]
PTIVTPPRLIIVTPPRPTSKTNDNNTSKTNKSDAPKTNDSNAPKTNARNAPQTNDNNAPKNNDNNTRKNLYTYDIYDDEPISHYYEDYGDRVRDNKSIASYMWYSTGDDDGSDNDYVP